MANDGNKRRRGRVKLNDSAIHESLPRATRPTRRIPKTRVLAYQRAKDEIRKAAIKAKIQENQPTQAIPKRTQSKVVIQPLKSKSERFHIARILSLGKHYRILVPFLSFCLSYIMVALSLPIGLHTRIGDRHRRKKERKSAGEPFWYSDNDKETPELKYRATWKQRESTPFVLWLIGFLLNLCGLIAFLVLLLIAAITSNGQALLYSSSGLLLLLLGHRVVALGKELELAQPIIQELRQDRQRARSA